MNARCLIVILVVALAQIFPSLVEACSKNPATKTTYLFYSFNIRENRQQNISRTHDYRTTMQNNCTYGSDAHYQHINRKITTNTTTQAKNK